MKLSPLVRAFGIGTVSGMRSMTAPAATLFAGGQHWAAPALLAAAGELIVDKLPFAPSRLSPPGLAVRVLSGAASGRAIAKRFDAPAALGTLSGALGALAGSYGGYHARRYLTTRRNFPDFPVALAEDALAIVVARASYLRF